jgi:hypothetical protein
MLRKIFGFAALCGTAAGQGSPQPGITVFQPSTSTTAYAIDLNGDVVHTWPGTARPGNGVLLAPNGDLLRSKKFDGGFVGQLSQRGGGAFERVSWDGEVLWDFEYSGPTFHAHHDIAHLPNGNILMIAWEAVGGDAAQDVGRNPANVGNAFVSEEIIEVEPDGLGGASVVWRWRAFDHLVQNFDPSLPNFGQPTDNPGRLDINFPAGNAGQLGDWLHFNGIDYNADLDQIVISVRTHSEIWIIDHSTTTQEAAGSTGGASGRGGDLLYRWGNPAAYGRGNGTNRTLYSQHDPTWIKEGLPGAGNMLIFNNGVLRPGGNFSSADEIILPLNANGTYDLAPNESYAPATATWVGTHPDPMTFYSGTTSGCQRLPNGNTLMVEGETGRFIEIDSASSLVWSWQSPFPAQGTKRTFKGRRHPGGVTGAPYCGPAVPNSTGASATIHGVGSLVAEENALTLWAEGLPLNTFGYFINSMTMGQTPMAGGSAGTLCLSGSIGRYSVSGQIFNSGETGSGSLALNLPTTPTPTGPVMAVAGQTWFFQCWFRDSVMMSNFTDGLQVNFQ